MSFAAVDNVESTWTPKRYAELNKDGSSLLNPLIETSASYNANGAINPRVRFHFVDVTNPVTLTFGATAAAMRSYVGKEYTLFTNDGASALTINTPTGAYIYGAGNAAPQANAVTSVPGTPSSVTVYVHSITHVQVVSAVNFA